MKSKKPKTDKKIQAAALELLHDPKFLFEVGQQVAASGVVGEERNRLVLYLACLTSSLERAVSVLVKGPTSTGKNNLTKAVLSLIPAEKVLTRSSFSNKALVHGGEELSGKILYMVEHRGGRDAQFYRRLMQSEGAVHHEATNVVGPKRGTEVASRIGDPVFISTTTDKLVYEDDETRFLSISADESAELTREVVRAQFKGKKEEDKVMDQTIWHEAFRILCEDVPEFRYPEWFDDLGERVPVDDSRARRDSPTFLSFLEAVARCRSFSDGRREKSKEIEIDFGDYCVAYPILSEAFASTYVGAHPRAMEFARAVSHLYGQSKKDVTTKDVAAHLGWTGAVAHKWRVEAVKQKLVQYKSGTYPQNKKPLLPGPAEHPTRFLPDPASVFNARPELGDVVKFIDPLSGKSVILRRRGGKVE